MRKVNSNVGAFKRHGCEIIHQDTASAEVLIYEFRNVGALKATVAIALIKILTQNMSLFKRLRLI